jgi:ATP/maltotriose-dependent transcriptional regulator MalT
MRVDRLVEREAELSALAAAVRDARTGRGSAVLVQGEAGIGKTSLVRAFRHTVDGTARVLAGACDDLLTPRTFGPLRDAVAGTSGPLAAALAGEPDRERLYRELLRELADPGRPTIVLVEDVHWADDATLDVLRFLARRLDRLYAVVVLTYRDDELHSGQLRQLLSMLTGATVHRLVLRPLSERAVDELTRAAGVSRTEIFATTHGNPFFVSEVLAEPGAVVPATVLDAVLGRIHHLPAATQRALEQLAVVPSLVETWLATALLGSLEPLAEAEHRGVIEARPGGVSFRHELARQAVEHALPVARRMALSQAVVEALLKHADVDLSRIVHHAVAAGDVETILARGPAAAREAAQAGAHRQALSHYEHVVAHSGRLPDEERAQILVEYAWQLYAGQRFDDAVDIARRAVELWEHLGATVSYGETLVVLSRAQYMADQPAEATRSIEHAVTVLEASGEPAARAYAQTYHGAILVLTDQVEQALERLAAARELAEQAGRLDLVALCLNYLGCAHGILGDHGGVDELRTSLAMARSLREYEYAARAYTNLGELLYQLHQFDALEECIAAGVQYAADHDLPAHAYNLTAHRAKLLMRRGDLRGAEAVLRRLIADVPDAGQLTRLTLPTLGRILARRGDAGAEQVLDQAWEVALRGDAIQALGPAGVARVEWAWLSGDVSVAQTQIDILLDRTATAAGARWRGELLTYLRRAGRQVTAFAGCPEPWFAALRGDWPAAAGYWRRLGDPYEEALEQAWSGEPAAMLEALSTLDRIGATAAAKATRRRLRDLGVSKIPRPRPAPAQENPFGLTDRQCEVLALLPDGLTNAEIANRLVISVRTVDHHVAAILAKLGASSRGEAARLATDLDLTRDTTVA